MPTLGSAQVCASDDFITDVIYLDECYVEVLDGYDSLQTHPGGSVDVIAIYRGGLLEDGTAKGKRWNIYYYNRGDTTDAAGNPRTAGTKATSPVIPGLPPVTNINPDPPNAGRPQLSVAHRNTFANARTQPGGNIWIRSVNPDEVYWIVTFSAGPFPNSDSSEPVETRIHKSTRFYASIEIGL